MTLAVLLFVHGDDPRMEFLYFLASVLLALTPVLVLGGLGIWLARKYLQERKED